VELVVITGPEVFAQANRAGDPNVDPSAEIDTALDNLEQRGLIKNHGNAQSADYHVMAGDLGHGQSTVLGTLGTT
jgi:hypothetical protein